MRFGLLMSEIARQDLKNETCLKELDNLVTTFNRKGYWSEDINLAIRQSVYLRSIPTFNLFRYLNVRYE